MRALKRLDIPGREILDCRYIMVFIITRIRGFANRNRRLSKL